MNRKEPKRPGERERRVEPERPIKREVYRRLCDIEMLRRY